MYIKKQVYYKIKERYSKVRVTNFKQSYHHIMHTYGL